MCKRPLQLKNPCKNFDVESDRLYIQVPCGHCSDCNNNKRFQWQVRVYYQYLETVKKGGFTLFMTLTYDDKHLPIAHVKHTSFEGDGVEKEDFYVSCFNKKDVQKFTKAVKTDVDRLYPGVDFKYFVTSEYGDDKLYVDRHNQQRRGTHRPHYHCLFFFIGEIPHSEARRILTRHWKGERKLQIVRDKKGNIVRNANGKPKYEWKLLGTANGHIDFTSRKGVYSDKGIVDGPGAIGYVCKYVQKDYNNDAILKEHLKHFTQREFNWKGDRPPRELIPFNMQSSGMGLYVVEYTRHHSPGLIEQGCCKFPMYKQGSKEIEYKVIDLPQYIERKLFCYDQKETPNRAYIYNEEGKEMLAARAVKKRNDLVERIENLLENHNTMIDSSLLSIINEKANRRYLRSIDFVQDIKSNLGAFSVRQLVDYSILFRDYIDLDSNGHYVTRLLECELDKDEFIEILKSRLEKDRTTGFYPGHDNPSFLKILETRVYHAELERSLFLISCYESSFSEITENAIQEKIAFQNRMSYFLKTRHYGYQLPELPSLADRLNVNQRPKKELSPDSKRGLANLREWRNRHS